MSPAFLFALSTTVFFIGIFEFSLIEGININVNGY